MSAMRLLFLVFFFLLAACGGGSEQPQDAETQSVEETDVESDAVPTLLEYVAANDRLSTLAEALEVAGLTEALNGEGTLTLFAPSNAAFGDLPAAVPYELLKAPENSALLRQILSYHVTSEELTSSQMAGAEAEVTTLEGSLLPFNGTGPVTTVGAAPSAAVVIVADVRVSNGVVHIIDRVLLPTE